MLESDAKPCAGMRLEIQTAQGWAPTLGRPPVCIGRIRLPGPENGVRIRRPAEAQDFPAAKADTSIGRFQTMDAGRRHA